jgi:hypothetical protein
MPMIRSSAEPSLTAALSKGFAKMLGAMPHRRAASGARRHRFRRFFRRAPTVAAAPIAAASIASHAADPIAMVVMAIDRLGPAAIRASCSGVNVRVAVPDDETAEVFRAALAVTQTRRTTDRLIEVVVDAKRGSGSLHA